METLNNIPFTVNTDHIMAGSHIEPGSNDAEELCSLVELAKRVGKPKAAYTMSFIYCRDGDSLSIDGIVFTSRTLSKNLQSVERVFPMVVTCGHEMDEAFPAKGDMLKEFWWDEIKNQLLGAANKYLSDHLHHKFLLGKTSTMHPGSGDATVWPIEQQQGLFALLGDVQGSIGVKLTESFLMIPNKTISGLLFPTEKDFRGCEVCHRENCPSRQVAFNKDLWEEIRMD
jgi:hypothetical protein